jgi:hypothetical protein
MLRMLSILLVASILTPAKAAPPVGGFPSVPERIESGCRDVDLVLVVKVANVRRQTQPRGELSEGDIRVIQVLKGDAKRTPKSISSFRPEPLMSDAFPIRLWEGMRYLWIVKTPSAPSWMEFIPLDEGLGIEPKETLAFAEKACGVNKLPKSRSGPIT